MARDNLCLNGIHNRGNKREYETCSEISAGFTDEIPIAKEHSAHYKQKSQGEVVTYCAHIFSFLAKFCQNKTRANSNYTHIDEKSQSPSQKNVDICYIGIENSAKT